MKKNNLNILKNGQKKNKLKDIDEIISYINQLFKIIFKYYLKPAQIISVLILSKKIKIWEELLKF